LEAIIISTNIYDDLFEIVEATNTIEQSTKFIDDKMEKINIEDNEQRIKE
jgi:hypothetical protein